MAGPAANTLPLAATGLSPIPWRNPTSVGVAARPLHLKVVQSQPCLLLRGFAPDTSRRKCAASGNGGQGLRSSQYQFDEDEPLWLAVVRDLAAGLRSLVAFLAEQPRQLKHLEWPGFQNTLRTAAFTLILISVFIVALSSLDAALSYTLSWLLRKSA